MYTLYQAYYYSCPVYSQETDSRATLALKIIQLKSQAKHRFCNVRIPHFLKTSAERG